MSVFVMLGSIPGLGSEKARPPVTVGEGSGHLRYLDAQATLKLQPGDTLFIRPGIYSGLSLGDLSGSAAGPITVRCASNTVFTTRAPQPNEFTNIAHVRCENFRVDCIGQDAFGRERYVGAAADVGAVENQQVSLRPVALQADNRKPLFKDFMGLNGCAGLTRKFVPKQSFEAVKQLYELVGNYRFKRVVKTIPREI